MHLHDTVCRLISLGLPQKKMMRQKQPNATVPPQLLSLSVIFPILLGTQ